MKVIFLDFDGVLNSEASFRYEIRRGNKHVSNSLSAVACSNLQYILEQDSSIKIIISSTWRKIHTMEELKNILQSYQVDSSKVYGKTPSKFSGHRGQEIRMWLEANPGVKFVILDDDGEARTALRCEEGIENSPNGLFVQTTAEDGLLFEQAQHIVKFFKETANVQEPK